MIPIYFLGAWGAVALFMTLLWFLQRRTGNAGIVDVGWAASIGAMAIVFAAVGDGDTSRRIATAVMGGVWGLRLAWHIHSRSHGRPEDGRYQALRREWAPHVQFKMFRFYQTQALAAALFAFPFLLPAVNAATAPHPLEIAGIILWLVGILGESLADYQLEVFKRSPDSKGKTCRLGLWRYSRHPNYFFEFVIWCAFALFASASPHGWLTILCPIAILYLLLRVTGIPATEEQALRSRGVDYKDYQRTTSMFVPWFPKR